MRQLVAIDSPGAFQSRGFSLVVPGNNFRDAVENAGEPRSESLETPCLD
jgi:hypothetical protein